MIRFKSVLFRRPSSRPATRILQSSPTPSRMRQCRAISAVRRSLGEGRGKAVFVDCEKTENLKVGMKGEPGRAKKRGSTWRVEGKATAPSELSAKEWKGEAEREREGESGAEQPTYRPKSRTTQTRCGQSTRMRTNQSEQPLAQQSQRVNRLPEQTKKVCSTDATVTDVQTTQRALK